MGYHGLAILGMKMYGLYVYWQESINTPYLIAVSESFETLRTMMPTIQEEYNQKYKIIDDYILDIEIVPVFVVTQKDNGPILLRKTRLYEEYSPNKLYGMNYAIKDTINQVLLKISHEAEESSVEYQSFLTFLRNHPLFVKNDFSLNSIQFDHYYDEGILNA